MPLFSTKDASWGSWYRRRASKRARCASSTTKECRSYRSLRLPSVVWSWCGDGSGTAVNMRGAKRSTNREKHLPPQHTETITKNQHRRAAAKSGACVIQRARTSMNTSGTECTCSESDHYPEVDTREMKKKASCSTMEPEGCRGGVLICCSSSSFDR